MIITLAVMRTHLEGVRSDESSDHLAIDVPSNGLDCESTFTDEQDQKYTRR